MTIGERIHELLKVNSKKQIDLANFIGVSQAIVSEWKTKGKTPSADLVYNISEFLGVSCKYLLIGSEDAVSNNEQHVLTAYRAADEGTRRAVDKLLDIP